MSRSGRASARRCGKASSANASGEVTVKCSSNYRYALGKRLPRHWSVPAGGALRQRRYLLDTNFQESPQLFTQGRVPESDGMQARGRWATFAPGNFIIFRGAERAFSISRLCSGTSSQIELSDRRNGSLDLKCGGKNTRLRMFRNRSVLNACCINNACFKCNSIKRLLVRAEHVGRKIYVYWVWWSSHESGWDFANRNSRRKFHVSYY